MIDLNELHDAADDLDRLEELEPRPGRAGLSNRLRRVADAPKAWWCSAEFTAYRVEPEESWGAHACFPEAGCGWVALVPVKEE